MKGGKTRHINDSVYLAPRHYGFTLQSQLIDGNFYYTDYISPEYEGALFRAMGKGSWQEEYTIH